MGKENITKDIAGFFEQALEIEQKSADIYAELSKLFSHVPEVSVIWDALAKEEEQHRDTLREIYNSLTNEQLFSFLNEDIMQKVHEIRNILNQDLISPIKNLNDAYELAHQLEYFEVEALFRFLANKVITSEERKNFILSEINDHQQKLMVFSNKFGDATSRRRVTIQST